jgi:hypothetical protein
VNSQILHSQLVLAIVLGLRFQTRQAIRSYLPLISPRGTDHGPAAMYGLPAQTAYMCGISDRSISNSVRGFHCFP